jgi:hypothetical protein
MPKPSYLFQLADDKGEDLLIGLIAVQLNKTPDAYKPLDLVGLNWFNGIESSSVNSEAERRFFAKPFFAFGYIREDRETISTFGAMLYPDDTFFISEGCNIIDGKLAFSSPQFCIDEEEMDIPGYRLMDDEAFKQLDLEFTTENLEIIQAAIEGLSKLVDVDMFADEKSFLKFRKKRTAALKGYEEDSEKVWTKNWDWDDLNLTPVSELWRAELQFG